MIRLEKFNFEGFPHVCNYSFEDNIYIVHGDYELHIISKSNKSRGRILVDEIECKNYEYFLVNKCHIVSKDNNIISNLSIKENFEIFSKNKKNQSIGFLSKYDLKGYCEKELDKIYAVLKAVFMDKSICIIEFEDKEIVKVLIQFINSHSLYERIIIILLDKNMVLNPKSESLMTEKIIFLKYFQGYISKKIVE